MTFLNEESRKTIEDLFVRYAAGVGRYVLVRVGSAELAEEITARVFLGVVRHFHQQRGSVVAWLWTIVRTELSRHFRERQHQPYPANMQAGNETDEVDRQERAQLLHDALEKLGDDAQQLIALKFFLGMSNRDIAETLNLTPSNVGVKVHRALKELRELLPASSYQYE